MKKVVITSIIILVTVVANINAQSMVSDGEPDTVSVGSLMPYTVIPDAYIESMAGSGLLASSQFDWKIESGTGTINTTQTALSLYPDSILITWGESPESAQISVAENSIKSGSVLCTGNTQTLNIEIVDLPTLNVSVDTAGCGVKDYNIPVDLTGYGPWEVSFNIDYTDLGGNTTTYNRTETIGTFGKTDGTYYLPVNLTTFSGIGAGEYDVVITNIDDRISLKALNDIKGTATASIRIIAAPTPNTGAIRHIEN